MADIKETSEALAGLNEAALVLIPILKDGVQVSDAVSLFAALQGNPEVVAKLVEAAKGIQLVGVEVSDLNMSEAMQLASMQLGYLPKFVEALKK